MWLKLIGLLFGGVSPFEALSKTYIKYKDSEIEHERVIAQDAKDQRDALLDQQKAANQVRLATSGFLEMRIIAAVIAGSAAFHFLLVTIDTSFATIDPFGINFGGNIPAYPKPMDEWEATILLSFFGLAGGTRAVQMATTVWAMSKR